MSEKELDKIESIHEYGIDYENNEIYLMGEWDTFDEEGGEPGVDYRMASKFITNLNILSKKPNIEKIIIHLKTCGGEWQEGMAIYDAIKSCNIPIHIINYTHARSMSSIIFLAADYRFMMPHSSYMFHYGESYFGGQYLGAQTDAKLQAQDTETMLWIYAYHLYDKGKFHCHAEDSSRASRQDIYDWIKKEIHDKQDVYFSAKAAVNIGFADEIIGE